MIYRLEACSVCRVVRVELITRDKVERVRSGLDRPEYFGDTPVYRIDMCDSCENAYEKHLDQLRTEHEAAERAHDQL